MEPADRESEEGGFIADLGPIIASIASILGYSRARLYGLVGHARTRSLLEGQDEMLRECSQVLERRTLVGDIGHHKTSDRIGLMKLFI